MNGTGNGHREILGIDVSSEEEKGGWLTLFRALEAAA
ncbi:hypothetical protein BKP42_44970 [Rhodococcus erythropolis]|nr:hypothetical protein BKP42_44970 [Rhodococcus erythropolis]